MSAFVGVASYAARGAKETVGAETKKILSETKAKFTGGRTARAPAEAGKSEEVPVQPAAVNGGGGGDSAESAQSPAAAAVDDYVIGGTFSF